MLIAFLSLSIFCTQSVKNVHSHAYRHRGFHSVLQTLKHTASSIIISAFVTALCWAEIWRERKSQESDSACGN